jgi:hypothetical protein
MVYNISDRIEDRERVLPEEEDRTKTDELDSGRGKKKGEEGRDLWFGLVINSFVMP